jgi:CRP-like cAMP-binding protein
LKKTLIVPDEPIRYVYFLDQGVASMLALLEGGGSVEVGMIDRDGMVGIHVLLGVETVTQECVVQIPGAGWRMEVAAFREAASESWLWKSEQRDKWSFCLKAASMRAAQERP